MSITNLVPPSATLAVNERIRRLIDAGQPILHLAFGEAGLPVPEEVVDALTRGAPDNGYGPVAGSPPARAAAAGWFDRRRLTTDPEQVVIAPGSKALLWALLAVLPGDVVLPQPSWVSYAAQAALAGKRVWGVPIAADGPGGVPDPAALEETLGEAARQGHRPEVIVVTLPDNPTGTVPDADHVRRLVEIAGEHGLSIISDEIYRDLAHEPGEVRSPAEYLPERTYVTSGLSKNMALGGWRIGFVRFPEGAAGCAAREALLGLASEVWSSAPAPMQHVAAHVLNEPPEVVAHIDRSRRLHRATTLAAHGRLVTGPSAAGLRPAASTCTPTSTRCTRNWPPTESTAAMRSPPTCSSGLGSPCSAASRSETSPMPCAAVWRRACCTARATISAGRRSSPRTRRSFRGSRAASTV